MRQLPLRFLACVTMGLLFVGCSADPVFDEAPVAQQSPTTSHGSRHNLTGSAEDGSPVRGPDDAMDGFPSAPRSAFESASPADPRPATTGMPAPSEAPSFEPAPAFDGARPTSDFAGSPSSATAPSGKTASGEHREIAGKDDVARKEAAPPRQQKPQSGLLTAGSFDDNQRFPDYQKYVSKVLQHDRSEVMPRFAVGERVEIQVVDPQRRPIGGARVVVKSEDEQSNTPLLETVTASDGRVVFCTAIDKAAGRQVFRVEVTPAGAPSPSTHTLKVAEKPWRITLEQESQLPRRLDLALVIDATGSMGDEMEYLKSEIDSIAASVHRMFPNVDQRYALIVYRDEGDEYVSRTFDFTSSIDDFRTSLAQQFADGGGDMPEAVHVAMEHADQLSWRDGDAARVMFLVADAPPHDQYLDRTLTATQALRRRGVRLYPLGGSGVEDKAQFVMRAMAFMTMGQYLFLTDHSGVGRKHDTPDVPEFQVERLDRMMIRMISSELAGKRLVPQEVIAIERGDLEPSAAPPVNQQLDQQPQAADQPAAAAAPLIVPSHSASITRYQVSHGGLASRFGEDLSWLAWAGLAAMLVGIFAFDALADRLRARV